MTETKPEEIKLRRCGKREGHVNVTIYCWAQED